MTGREALFINGETPLQIPSLSLPKKDTQDLAELANSEAVQLFVSRAQTAQSDFAITVENAPAVAEIVRRLDGIPLALELAAARLRMMSVEMVIENLNNRFRLLTGGRRTALPRQQTLQALIDWSWNLLDENEQVLLGRLSVFSGGWTLQAAQSVASDENIDAFSILELLEQLINKSLITVERPEQSDVRYSMLESIHQYARDRLFETGAGATLRNRHAEYFVSFQEEATVGIEGREALLWINRLIQENSNGTTAREWMLEERLDLAVRMTETSELVLRYWYFSREGVDWLEQVLQKIRAHPNLNTDVTYKRGLACATTSLGAILVAHGALERAKEVLDEGVVIAEKLGIIRQQILGMLSLLIYMVNVGDYGGAEQMGEDALVLSRKHNLLYSQAMLLGNYTVFLDFEKDHQKANTYMDEAIRLSNELGNPWVDAIVLFLQGQSEKYSNNWAAAEVLFAKSVELFKIVRDPNFPRIALSEVAHMKRLLGDHVNAEKLYRQTIVAFQERGHYPAVAHQLECFGMIAIKQNHYPRTAKLLAAAQTLRNDIQANRLPPEQVEYEELLEQLTKMMGQDERDTSMAEGAKMSLDEAVEFALEEINP